MAANGIAQAHSNAAADAAALRMQEQMAAQNQLAGVLQGARGQDLSLAQAMQSQGQNLNMANANLGLQSQAQKDALLQYFTGAGLGIDTQGFQAQIAKEQARQQAYQNAQGINAGVAQQNAAANTQLTGGVLSAGGAAGAAAIGKK
jgi:hypothetical protein